MKALAVTFLIVAAIVAALYYFGLSGMDPAVEAANFKNAVSPGMTWQEVVEIKAPRKVIAFREMGEAPATKWDDAKSAVEAGQYTMGYKFPYTFTAEEAYDVYFSADGKVTSIEDQFTTSDLLKGKAFQN